MYFKFSKIWLAMGVGGLTASLALGGVQARCYGTVEDEAGNMISGVKVAIAKSETATPELVVESNEAGEYSVLLGDATIAYYYRLEKEGYKSFVATFKIPTESNTEMNFTIESVGRDAPLFYNQGAEAARSGDLELAAQKFRQASELDPQLVSAHIGLATVLLMQQKFREAMTAAEAATALEPENSQLLQISYKALQALGETEQAAAVLARLEAADPKAAAAGAYNRGLTLFELGKFTEAKAVLTHVVEEIPDHAQAHYMLGICAVNSGDNQAAKSHLGKFLELSPEDPEAPTAREMLEYLQ